MLDRTLCIASPSSFCILISYQVQPLYCAKKEYREILIIFGALEHLLFRNLLEPSVPFSPQITPKLILINSKRSSIFISLLNFNSFMSSLFSLSSLHRMFNLVKSALVRERPFQAFSKTISSSEEPSLWRKDNRPGLPVETSIFRVRGAAALRLSSQSSFICLVLPEEGGVCMDI